MNHFNSNNVLPKGLPLRAEWWFVQAVLAAACVLTGLGALSPPTAEISTTVPWAAHVPEEFLKFIGAVDLAAGAGVLLAALTRIAPDLTVLATLCSAALQILAIIFYALVDVLGLTLLMNLAVSALSMFVAWGRSGKASIASRRRTRLRDRRSHGNRRFRIQRGLRGALFHRAGKEELRQ